jgi:hypothetical protein
MTRAAAVLVGALVVAAACAGGDDDDPPRDAAPILRVPGDHATIQAAVDAAEPGGLVLVAPGVYRESVRVTTPGIVVRGLDRDETVVDGELRRDNGFDVRADGVAIENITARRFVHNGFVWTGVRGYRGSYLTAVRNGDYGIYAFDSTRGQFDHSYASGSASGGFYVGQCSPCEAVVTDVLAEWNGIGYSGTNASGDLLVVRSTWRHNRVGIFPNSGTFEERAPQHDAVFAGNTVYGNDNAEAPALGYAPSYFGIGIMVAGGNDNLVARNLVYDHDVAGIAVVSLPETLVYPDLPSARDFDARGNEVRDNAVRDSGVADLVVVATLADPADAGGNCFAHNAYSTARPDRLPVCGGRVLDFEADVGWLVGLYEGGGPAARDYRTAPLPPPGALAEMPDAASAPARPATRGVPVEVDVDAIERPAR